MTPEQKAKELYSKINSEIPIESSFSDTIESANEKLIKDHKSTKACCLILVDEILSFLEDDRDSFSWKEYYKQVKNEIEKM